MYVVDIPIVISNLLYFTSVERTHLLHKVQPVAEDKVRDLFLMP
jgi:hypothetical protein